MDMTYSADVKIPESADAVVISPSIVGDRFVQGLGIAGKDSTAGTHGLQQAPRQHERIGQVHMHGGDLQHGHKMLIRDLAQEMNT